MILILERALNSAVRLHAKAFNQMKALTVTAPAEFFETLVSLTTAALVNRCESLRPGGMDGPVAAAKYNLRPLARRCCQMGKEIRDLGTKVRRLARQAFPALVDTLGIGTDMVATLVIAAGSNADRIHPEAAFAYLCGGNPIPASSAKTNGHRLRRGGQRRTTADNTALHRIVFIRLRSDQRTRAYIHRST